jgi:tetratricopeptide (TPR) repeat protein
LLSKPSALGLLPLLACLEWAGGAEFFQGKAPDSPPLGRRLMMSLPLLIPLTALSVVIILVNLAGHTATLVPPPGGSLYTALLTDVEVLARYLWNAVAPFQLSFVYYVEPIVSLAYARLWLFGLLLAGVAAATIYVAENRRRAVLGWIWFIVALSPQLNIVSLLQIMQDRYLYLSLPGLFLVIYETSAGIASRMAPLRRPMPLLAGAWIVLFAVLSFQRSPLFTNIFRLFGDAVAKQPQAAHAQWGMSLAYAQLYELAKMNPQMDPEKLKSFHDRQGEHAILFMRCPDRVRQPNYTDLAVDAGIFSMERQDLAAAERYFQLAVEGLPCFPDLPKAKGEALKQLASLRLAAGRLQEGYDLATEAIVQVPGSVDAHFLRACAAIALLNKGVDAARAAQLKEQSREDLALLPSDHPVYNQAQKMLERLAANDP